MIKYLFIRIDGDRLPARIIVNETVSLLGWNNKPYNVDFDMRQPFKIRKYQCTNCTRKEAFAWEPDEASPIRVYFNVSKPKQAAIIAIMNAESFDVVNTKVSNPNLIAYFKDYLSRPTLAEWKLTIIAKIIAGNPGGVWKIRDHSKHPDEYMDASALYTINTGKFCVMYSVSSNTYTIEETPLASD